MIICILLAFLACLPFNIDQATPTFTVNVQGVDAKDVVSEGVKPDELAQLTVLVDDETVVVKEFDVVHARGKSPVNMASATGNSFDVSAFRKQVRAGDRIVINVKTLLGANDTLISVQGAVLQIPIR